MFQSSVGKTTQERRLNLPAKGKYTPDVIEAIQFAIQKTGRDKDGIKAGGIGHDTFYKWLKEKPEFSDVIAQAKKYFRDTQWSDDPEIMKEAVESFKMAIRGNNEAWKTESDYERDEKGNLIKKITTHAVKRPGQPWAINLMLNPGGSIKGVGRKDMIGGEEDRKKLEDWINDNTYE